LEYETEYTAHISADVADEAENHLEESYSWNFTTSKKPDTTPPQIIEGGPLAENHNVSVIAEIEITFNEIIDTANLYIVPDDNPDLKIEGIIGETGHETTFNFENSLEYSTEYTAYLSATDLAGNEAEYSWTFTTKEHMVISTYPEDGEENVMRGYLVISAVFGESFDTASLYVTPTNNPDLKIEGIVKETPWNWDRISYDFSYLLEYSTEYTAYLSVTDLAGNEISYSWNFTTQENMVASTYPENGAENVSVNIETIRVEFKDLIVDAEIFCGYSWENPDGSTSSKSIQGDVIIDGKTITLTVEFPLRLRYSTKYSGFVILKNIEGNNIFSYEWFFTTEENPGE
jgi:hypothetical protein